MELNGIANIIMILEAYKEGLMTIEDTIERLEEESKNLHKYLKIVSMYINDHNKRLEYENKPTIDFPKWHDIVNRRIN